MKYLIVLLVVFAAVWLITAPRRRLQRREEAAPRPAPPPAPLPDSIVACPQCGLHLPRGEALPGRGGYYCSEAHRRLHELAHPPA